MNGGPKTPQSCLCCGSYLEKGKKGSIEIVYPRAGPFCLECLNKLKLDEIDIGGVIEDLTKKGYGEAPERELLRKALKNFKEGKMLERLNLYDGTITYYFQEKE